MNKIKEKNDWLESILEKMNSGFIAYKNNELVMINKKLFEILIKIEFFEKIKNNCFTIDDDKNNRTLKDSNNEKNLEILKNNSSSVFKFLFSSIYKLNNDETNDGKMKS
jgi:hypothetical protein